MHVVATAGHVDHGKSALVRALTGHEPDRLAQERSRGLSIELGYVWTTLPAAGDVAFVDVPGHERFISTTLAGLGPAPVVLFVVAADDPWMPQAAEHLAALDALGVRRAVLAVTRADLADPAPARERALTELADTSLHAARAVEVSARTGEGMGRLRAALEELLLDTPRPDPHDAVRMWVDRDFTVTGAGTVVTGTLTAGRVGVGDRLTTARGAVRVRTVESLGRPVHGAEAVARVALNVSGDVTRGDVLTSPDAWWHTTLVDVRVSASRLDPAGRPPRGPMLHIGATTTTTHVRLLDGAHARIRLGTALPLRIGDRALLRDPGTRRLWGVTVLDPAPPPLRRRGSATLRGAELAAADGRADLRTEVARRGLVARRRLHQLGVVDADPAGDDGMPGATGGAGVTPGVVAAGDWLLSGDHAARLARAAVNAVHAHSAGAPLEPGLTLAALATRLGLPGPDVVTAVVGTPLRVEAGRVVDSSSAALPPEVTAAVAALRAELSGAPFAAPPADRLATLGLTDAVQAAAARAGLILRPGPGVVLLAGADAMAVQMIAALPQPFTVSEARRCLGTSRRVVLPLLAHLDHAGRTRRLADDRRELTGR